MMIFIERSMSMYLFNVFFKKNLLTKKNPVAVIPHHEHERPTEFLYTS